MINDTFCKRVENELILRGFSKAGEIALCCKSQDPFPIDSNFGIIQEVKDALNNGIKHKHCTCCWQQERKGIYSWRQVGNEMLMEFKNVELYLDNTCDLACIYCSPKYSSRWSQEIKIQKENGRDIQKYVNADYYDEKKENYNHLPRMLKYVELLGKQAKNSKPLYLNLLGGEPLLTSAIKKDVICDIIDAFFSQTTNDQFLGINIVSNCNTPEHVINKTIKLLKQNFQKYKNLRINLTASVESTGEVAEFIRYGLDWNIFEKNLKKWFLLENTNVSFSMAVNIISWKFTPDFFVYVFKKAEEYNKFVNINFNTVMFPKHLSIQMLPDKFLKTYDNIESILYKNKHLIVHDKVFKKIVTQIEQSKHDFGILSKDKKYKSLALGYFDYMRNYRNKDIRKINPELFDFLSI